MSTLLGNARTHDTPWSVDEAIGWLHDQATRRTTGWHNVCLGITAKAYGYAASGTLPARPGRSGWAIEAWQQADPATKHPGVFDNVPRGGIIHYKGRPGTPGHTTTSNGDGREWTNDAEHDLITLEPIGVTAKRWGMKMVGWREPKFARGTGRNPATPRPIPAPRPEPAPKPTRGVTKVLVATRPRVRPGRDAPVVKRRGKALLRKPGHRVVYRGVRVVQDPERGKELWLHSLNGWILARRTKRGE